jgi:hypothetical protein
MESHKSLEELYVILTCGLFADYNNIDIMGRSFFTQLPPLWPRFDPSSCLLGFMTDKGALFGFL